MKKEMLIQDPIGKGWFHQEHFMDEVFCLELLNETKEFQYWTEAANDTSLQRKYLVQMKKLMDYVNHSTIFYLGVLITGGELVIYTNDIYHDILPTTGSRYSLSGCFRTAIAT